MPEDINVISVLQEKNWVEKQNILNEMKSTQMSLQEIRFFSIYLSKINARDVSTREVDFPLIDFLKIMDIGKVNISSLKLTLGSLLSKVVFLPNEDSGFSGFQLFKECVVYTNKATGLWHVKINAHDKALKYMFDFKERYFKYELWNALSLKSANQIRMYEILKQYETLGVRTIEIDELKKLLGITPKSYPRFNSFRERVIDTAKRALYQYTDICFEYKTICRGRKVTAIQFTISNNKNCKNKINLDEFVNNRKEPQIIANEADEEYELYSEVFDGMFDRKQLELLYHLALPMIRQKVVAERKDRVIEMADYFRYVFKKFGVNSEQVKYPFAYVKKLITAEVENYV